MSKGINMLDVVAWKRLGMMHSKAAVAARHAIEYFLYGEHPYIAHSEAQ